MIILIVLGRINYSLKKRHIFNEQIIYFYPVTRKTPWLKSPPNSLVPVSLDLVRSGVSGRDGSLLRSRFFGCHATFPQRFGGTLRDIQKTAARETRGTGESTGRAREASNFILLQIKKFCLKNTEFSFNIRYS